MEKHQLKILGFLCNWCSYAGADLAGVSRIQYPPDFRAIRVMCSGRVDPAHILDAFTTGWDGVMILGCHFGDCHYISGNYEAEIKVQTTALLLEQVGIDPDRLYVDWVSAGEGQKFAELIKMFSGRIASIGQLGGKEGLDDDILRKGLAIARDVAEAERVRWLMGRKKQLLEEENIMGNSIDEDYYNRLLHDAVLLEYKVHAVRNCLEKSPLSVKELAKRLHLSPNEILSLVVELKRNKKVASHSIDGNTPKYIAIA